MRALIVLVVLMCATCRVAFCFVDGLLPNGNFELAPNPSDLNGTVVLKHTAIPEWETSGFVEYIKAGQKQGDMLLVVPEGAAAVRLGNEASIKQRMPVTKGMYYSLTFSAARTCAQEETLNVSVAPDFGVLPMQTLYSSNGWDSYAWAFQAEVPVAAIVIHNPGVSEDPACGPLIDSIAIRALYPPRLTKYVRQLPKNFRQSYIVRPGLKKLLDLPLQQRKAPLVLNFIPTYTSKLADVPRQRKKSASPSTASTEQVASTSEPVNQPSTSAPHSIPVQEKKRRRRLVKAAQMKQPQKKVLNLLAILPDDMDDEPALPTPQPKTKRMKKTQPKAKVTEVDDAEDAVPISKLTKNTTSAPAKRPAEVQPTGATQQKKQKSAAGTSSGSRGPKIPWEPKITLEDRPVYKNESAADPQIGVALSTAVLLDGDMEKNEKMGGYENYARMLQHSVQAIQHAHSFSMLAFETGKRLEDTEKELADLKRSQKKDQLRMKKLEDQAAEATKAKQIADEKAEATEALRTVAVAQQKEAEEKAAQAQKELQEGLATKEADLNAFYNKGMEDVAADYELQVKQACNHGFILGYNALAKKLNLPADSPWRKTESLRLPCPLPPSPSQAEVESESEAEAEDETLVRKARSPTKIDLTRDEEVEAAPKKTDFGTLTSDLLLIGRSVEETVAEIDAEVAADKVAEVATDKPAEVSQNKEAEVVVEGQTKVVAEESAEVVPEGPSEVSTQPTPEAEAA